jgi:hypothetical protein
VHFSCFFLLLASRQDIHGVQSKRESKMKLGQLVLMLSGVGGLLSAPLRSIAAVNDTPEYSQDAIMPTPGGAELSRSLLSGSTMTVTCNVNKAAIEMEEGSDWTLDTSISEPRLTETAALDWLQNELQMSIDPSSEPQGFVPDFTCIDPPYNCPANVKCPLNGGGNAICVVTSCGQGTCSACPIKSPGWVITSWCAYGCMKGKDVVGGAYGFWVRFLGWRGPLCFPG